MIPLSNGSKLGNETYGRGQLGRRAHWEGGGVTGGRRRGRDCDSRDAICPNRGLVMVAEPKSEKDSVSGSCSRRYRCLGCPKSVGQFRFQHNYFPPGGGPNSLMARLAYNIAVISREWRRDFLVKAVVAGRPIPCRRDGWRGRRWWCTFPVSFFFWNKTPTHVQSQHEFLNLDRPPSSGILMDEWNIHSRSVGLSGRRGGCWRNVSRVSITG